MYSVQLTPEFEAWLDGIKDRTTQVRIVARLRQAEAGNLGDWKPVGGRISEMRVHSGSGYRLYIARAQRILLGLEAST